MGSFARTLAVLLLPGLLVTCNAFGFNFGGSSSSGSGGKEFPVTTPVPAATTPVVRAVNTNGVAANEPHYTFRYMVQDARTGDFKSQEERRDGGHVRGTYSVAEPNGDLRVVSYSADGDSGFRAEVRVEPASTIPMSLTPEGRTFANFLTNPFNLFRTGTSTPSKPPVYERPLPVVTSFTRPVISPQPTMVYADRPNVYAEKPNVYDRPSYTNERPVFTADPMDELYHDFDRTRLPDTSVVPVTPTRYPYDVMFGKPASSATPVYYKPEEYSAFRPHLPETPAIPITPSPVADKQSDIITGSMSVAPNVYPPRFQMLRKPIIPTRPTPIRISTPSLGTYSPSPFSFMRYTPSVVAPPVAQIQQKYWQNGAQLPFTGIPTGGYPVNYGGQQYMLVRTYLMPIPPGGRLPPNMMPMQTINQQIVPTANPVNSTPVKATSVPVPTETEVPVAVTTTQAE